jgi:hypothetical protein
MFPSFFTSIFRGSSTVLCAVTIPPSDLRSLSLYYYTVCGHAKQHRLNERKSEGGTATAQSTAEDPLKMVVKKDGNM